MIVLKKGHLIYNKFESIRNKWLVKHYIEEAAKLGLELELLIEEHIDMYVDEDGLKIKYKGVFMDRPEFVIMRTRHTHLAYFYEHMGARVFNNSKVHYITNDKMNGYVFAKSLGIDVLATEVKYDLDEDEENIPYPFVFKPLDGKGGLNVFLIQNMEDYKEAFIINKERPYLRQEVASEVGKDLRIYIIGGEVVCAYLRTSNGDFRSNFCLGGNATRYELGEAEKAIVEKVVSNLDVDYIGLDLLFHNGKPVFNEMENVVGARMVYDGSDLDIVGMYLAYIVKQLS